VETERLLKGLDARGTTYLLTREGESLDSADLAKAMQAAGVAAVPEFVFLIGGAFGVDRSLLAAGTRTLTLSPLTLPHEMARLVLLEQIYRAGTIVRNEPYHKGA